MGFNDVRMKKIEPNQNGPSLTLPLPSLLAIRDVTKNEVAYVKRKTQSLLDNHVCLEDEQRFIRTPDSRRGCSHRAARYLRKKGPNSLKQVLVKQSRCLTSD